MKQALLFPALLAAALPCLAQDYCELSCQCDEYISRVALEAIDNNSGCLSYSDYTSLSATLTEGRRYQITVEIGNAYFADQVAAWIDLNRDYAFVPEERILLGIGPGPLSAEFSVPVSAAAGLTRLRVRLCFNQTPYPCGDCTYGEVEDYSILIEELMCGDSDGNGFWNIADAVRLIDYIFGGGPAPDPLLSGDADGNCVVSIADAVYLIGYIFGGGPQPVCAPEGCK